ncbi:MAG: envelope stress response membrane protein PspC [Desulfovibrio sp.]|uniref:envelope stress response membrane protein PspC n=1 Tax=Desulfovibrio sp. 7SRBS1 TaxID=3378064 RepID=UPI003B3EE841
MRRNNGGPRGWKVRSCRFGRGPGQQSYGPDGRTGPYRSRNGKFLGVCRGMSEYYGLPLRWVRIGVIAAAIFTGIWPALILYVIVAFLLKPEPVVPLKNESEQEFYESYASSREQGLSRLKRKFDQLDKRIRRMEDHVTSKEFEWDERFNQR